MQVIFSCPLFFHNTSWSGFIFSADVSHYQKYPFPIVSAYPIHAIFNSPIPYYEQPIPHSAVINEIKCAVRVLSRYTALAAHEYFAFGCGSLFAQKNRTPKCSAAVDKGIEPLFSPWEGDVLAAWPIDRDLWYQRPAKKASTFSNWIRTFFILFFTSRIRYTCYR